MSDVFISYAREDRERARQLAEVLEQQHWTVWWDREIPPGHKFADVISEQLASAKAVIVLWSTSAVASDWVKDEAQEGATRRLLVPAQIDRTAIPFGFRQFQTADLSDWHGEASHPEVRALQLSVARLIKKPAVVGPPTAWERLTHALKGQRLGPAVLVLGIFAVALAGYLLLFQSGSEGLAVIEHFGADRAAVVMGDTVTLRWAVSNADSIELQPFGRAEASGTKQVTITTNGPAKETYTLVATNRVGRQARSVDVTVQASRGSDPPVIEEFAVEPQRARTGDTVTIRWRVSHATSATLKPGGAVPLQGERTIEVRDDASKQLSFELIAVNREGRAVTRSATVAVLPASRIVVEEFTAEPAAVVEGQPVTVRWRVRNAEVVEVSPFGKVEAESRRGIRATAPRMLFELTASKSGQQAEKRQAFVRVQPSSAFGVSSATLTAINPAMSGPCPLKVEFRGIIRATGRGAVAYTFERSDGASSLVRQVEFTEAGARRVTTSWTLSASFGGWQRLKIVSPNEISSDRAAFTVTCQ